MRYGLALVFLGLVLAPVGQTAGDKKITIYESLGAEKGITQIVEDFFAILVADPKIRKEHKDHFTMGDVAGLKRKLIDQLGEATGGPQKYKGKNMKDAHKGMKITNADFDALLADLKKAFDKNKVSAPNQQYLLKALDGMRKAVVEVPEKSSQLSRPTTDALCGVRCYPKLTRSPTMA